MAAAATTLGLAERLPFDNRIEPGSVNILPATLPVTKIPDNVDARQVAADVVKAVSDAWTAKDYEGVARLFTAQGAWRDHLGLSWGLRTLQGADQITAYLQADGHGAALTSFTLDESVPHRAPTVDKLDVHGASPCIVFFTTFTTTVGTGRGVVRVVHEDDGVWRIVTFYTSLETIKGCEEPLGPRRPLGASHGGGRNMKNWAEQRAEDAHFEQGEPTVLIIGAGQGGLTAAARLKMLQVPTLVVDREDRVGDNWRRRYRQLVLHDPVWFDHLPYLPFPPSWPVFTPKDKLADFFEAYVRLLELNVWTQTEIVALRYDAARKRYDVTVERRLATTEGGGGGKKETRTFHPRHIIQATGHSGKMNMPAVPGLDRFKGRLCHSSEFPGADPQPENSRNAPTKKRAVVVGSCNSGHDIAQDLYENGYDVTMVQRSSTCVVSSEAVATIGIGGHYSEAVQARLPCEDADLLNHSLPTPFTKANHVQVTEKCIAHDAQLLTQLEQAGFRLDRGVDGSGLLVKYPQRGGGYYIDVGASQLIIEGKIKIKSGQGVAEVLADGLRLADGTVLPADEIVFATGFQNMRTQTRVLFGDALADKCTDVWGYNAEGEIRTMWQRSGQPGYWFMGGNLALARYYGRFLALQIKAQEEGLTAYD
ncbi:flavin-binding monooxygenase-like protein [Niveomyces insectorum RCEF 264]|uniref:Flavin-binding monooxygenase-like protein n=1 Tax=Niveomyces insectorum RCEF 264 TaxID=1081102 RepID=A0A167RE01_9HYPO|nr:flavin-binding monooxygenase-like protein [Niveomyces insectorum RCEF 264]